MSYDDKESMGRSKITPFVPGEGAKKRHVRRLDEALKSEWLVDAWCEDNGCTLTIHNDGHHWCITGAIIAEWWPSSAKLVFDREYTDGIHCHDYVQFISAMERRLNG